MKPLVLVGSMLLLTFAFVPVGALGHIGHAPRAGTAALILVGNPLSIDPLTSQCQSLSASGVAPPGVDAVPLALLPGENGGTLTVGVATGTDVDVHFYNGPFCVGYGSPGFGCATNFLSTNEVCTIPGAATTAWFVLFAGAAATPTWTIA